MKNLLTLRCLIKFLICILAIFIYILFALLSHLLLVAFGALRFRVVSQLNRKLAKFISCVLGIKIIVEGEEFVPKKGNFFIFSNHLTYLDGIILCSLFSVLFVSKREVMSWPLFGQMAFLGATIFIDRKRKDKSYDYTQSISRRIKNKVNVLIFPEGTSTDGTKLLPFQTIFFNPPIITKTPILPIAIRYIKIENEELSEKNKDRVYWYGNMPFFNHLWNFVRLKGITVVVKINPAIESTNFTDGSLGRKELSNACYEVISRALKNS